jgi:hypothetical protein
MKKFPYSKQVIGTALVLSLALPVSSASATSTGQIDFSLLKSRTAGVADGNLTADVLDLAGNVIKNDVPLSSTGTLTVNGLATGSYEVIVSDPSYGTASSDSATIKAVVAVKDTKTTTSKVTYLQTSAESTTAKGGAIFGFATGLDNAALDGAEVIIKGKTTDYTVKTKSNGTFKAFVPAGTYDVILKGKSTNAVNTLYKGVKVTSGQTSSTMDDMAEVVDASATNVITTSTFADINADAKEISGKALDGATVRLIDVTSGDTTSVDTAGVFVAQAVAKAPRGLTDGTGEFKIKFPKYMAGKTLKLVAYSTAGNVEEVTNIHVKNNSATAMLLKPDASNNIFSSTIDIGFSDKYKLLTYKDGIVVKANFSIYKTTSSDTVGVQIPVTDYTVTSSKVSFATGKLVTTADTANLIFKANGYEDNKVVQIVKP